MLDHFTLHRRAARVLPPAIRTSQVVAEDDPGALAKLLFPLRRKSNGVLVYRLTEAAASAIADDPLAYLKDAVRAREGVSRRRAPFAYRAWRKVLLRTEWTTAWLPPAGHRIPSAIEVYFTVKTDGKALLAVIPGQRLAFYLWCD
jgi:hypothetical protein